MKNFLHICISYLKNQNQNWLLFYSKIGILNSFIDCCVSITVVTLFHIFDDYLALWTFCWIANEFVHDRWGSFAIPAMSLLVYLLFSSSWSLINLISFDVSYLAINVEIDRIDSNFLSCSLSCHAISLWLMILDYPMIQN